MLAYALCRNIYGFDSSISEPNNVLGIDKKEVDVVAGLFSRRDVRGTVWFVEGVFCICSRTFGII